MSASQPTADAGRIELGLRQNLPQFALLVAVNGLVGGMLGQERTVLPLLGEQKFGLRAYTAELTFIAVFGLAKAATTTSWHLVGPLRTQAGARHAAGSWPSRSR